MAEVHPLRGWRFDVGRVGELSHVLASPAVALDAGLRERLSGSDPFNAARLMPLAAGPNPVEAAHRAVRQFKDWQHDGVLRCDPSPGFYLLQQRFAWEGRAMERHAVIALVSNHRSVPIQTGPMDAIKFLYPVVGLYESVEPETLTEVLEATRRDLPQTATDGEGVVHRLWTVHQQHLVHRLQAMFHRVGPIVFPTSESHPSGGPELLVGLVAWDDPGLIILPNHGVGRAGSMEDITRRMNAWQSRGVVELVGQGPEAARACWELVAESGQTFVGIGIAADQSWSLVRLRPNERFELDSMARRKHHWQVVSDQVTHREADWGFLEPLPDRHEPPARALIPSPIVSEDLVVHPTIPVGLVFHASK